MGRLALVAVLVVAACSGGDDTATTAEATTTTLNPLYRLTAESWANLDRTPEQARYEYLTELAFGIGTSGDRMLEYGYDLCEMFESQSNADAIRDWAVANNHPLPVASQLGAAASDYLCP